MTNKNTFSPVFHVQYTNIFDPSAKSKQTEKSSRMKSACQCEQRQGTTCFRKQTANVARWIFHCRATLMRGSRGVLPRDCIVILRTVPPLTA